MKKILFFLCFWSTIWAVKAELKLPRIFSSNMVLQRDKPIPVWGTATSNAPVLIELQNHKVAGQADKSGKFLLYLPAKAAGGPYTLKVTSGKEVLSFQNILMGDVWLAAGQSNMQFGLKNTDNGAQAVAEATYKNIRLFTVPNEIHYKPQVDFIKGNWVTCTPETAQDFSAVGYYFARRLHQDKNVPIGIINASWGGTPIEVFISVEGNKTMPYHRAAATEIEQKPASEILTIDRAKATPQQPATIFNAMIAPLIPYSLKGMLWYQGEHNWKNPYRYREQLAQLIQDWRIRWQNGYLPFLVVQLPNNGKKVAEPGDHFWANLRESQAQVLALPYTGLAVTIDIGKGDDLHPTNKKDVGERLALLAKNMVYGDKLVFSGPQYLSSQVEGASLRVQFSHTGSGLTTKANGPVTGFAIAGDDRKFYWATAWIENNTVVVSSPQVPKPMAVRYAWAGDPDISLFNREGLPAAPFRTDNWELKADGTW